MAKSDYSVTRQKLSSDHEKFLEDFARNYLAYFGNLRPSLKQLRKMKALLSSHWFKRQVSFDIRLSKREKECLYHLYQGKQIKEIAQFRGVSQSAIKQSIRSMLDKLGCKNVKQAIVEGIKYGDIKIISSVCFE